MNALKWKTTTTIAHYSNGIPLVHNHRVSSRFLFVSHQFTVKQFVALCLLPLFIISNNSRISLLIINFNLPIFFSVCMCVYHFFSPWCVFQKNKINMNSFVLCILLNIPLKTMWNLNIPYFKVFVFSCFVVVWPFVFCVFLFNVKAYHQHSQTDLN